jgi:outer membrane protein OmpA-like peptidoglycan-associated protein
MFKQQTIKPATANQPDSRRDMQQLAAPVSDSGRRMEPQRGIGNQAVTRLLQRRVAANGAPGAGANRFLQRKCACGGTPGMTGECEECSKKKIVGLQTKLRINEPGDIYEQEADRVADQVLAMPAQPGDISAPPRIQRYKGQGTEQIAAAPASVDRALAGPGRPLEPALRQDMEQRFGRDFSRVRVHLGVAAEQSAWDVDAEAYAVGQNIVFGAGRFAPRTHEGRRLLAHELTHVVQQAELGRTAHPSHVSNGDRAEVRQEAATGVLPTRGTEGMSAPSAPMIRRQPVRSAPALTRAEEIRLSLTSPGEISVTLNPPTLTLYNFPIDRSTLKKSHVAALKAIAFLTNQFAGPVKIVASGHADSTGEEGINVPLSHDRVAGVQTAIQGATGLPVFVAWFSDYLPAATNDTVEGRSRNRRVDISFTVGKTDPQPPEPCQGPQLLLCACQRSPELCKFCLDHPALCFCAVFFEICLYCVASLTKAADCFCRLFPCKDEPEKKKRKACPDKVHLPWGEKRIDPARAGDDLRFPFDMDLTFLQERAEKSPYCDCNCGEYRQYVTGYFKRDDGTGVLKDQEHWLTSTTKLKPYPDFQEDGMGFVPRSKGKIPLRQEYYGHRYLTDRARSMKPLASNVPNDQFLDPNREVGCTYHGHDNPGLEAWPNEEVHFHLWFRGGPVDACNGDREIGDRHAWEVVCDRVPHPPHDPGHSPLVNRPFIVRSGLPKDPKVGQEVTLEIAFPDQPPGCYGKIPVSIIGVSDIGVTIWTRNSDPVHIAPDACPDVWVLPYQSVTIPQFEEEGAKKPAKRVPPVQPSTPAAWKGTFGAFGEEIGWPAAGKIKVPARAVDLAKLRNAGVTEQWAVEQAQIYREVARLNPANPTAALRAEWLGNIAVRLGAAP